MNAPRILRQKLEDLQRAGLTTVPSAMAELVDEVTLQSAGAAKAETSREESRSAPAAASPPPKTAPKTTETPSPAVVADAAASPKRERPVPKRACDSLSLPERESKLASLAERVAACQKCQELADTRTQTVFGVGNPEARIMFIGEAPGADEDKQGEPFVGRAGKLLNKIIEAMQLTREEIYICNILRCRPPGNRNPSPKEAENCREFLDGQIETVSPEYIVCWGSIAAKNLLDTDKAIGKMRGQFYEYGGAKVVCTYHPSYLLRNPSAKKEVWKDMKFLMKDMGVELD